VCLPLGLAALGPSGRLCPGTAVTRFESGDSVLLYTDGVIGDEGAVGETLPLAALLADVADAYPEHVVATIHAEMTGRRRGKPRDDQAVLYLYQP
jgi:hypothetical protein